MELHSHRFAANPQTLIHHSWQSTPVAPDVPVPLPARPIVLTFDDGYATRMEGFR
jgi:peptidoglycan/xylan/chitin deacetylase (PgdA/CDA1 family)